MNKNILITTIIALLTTFGYISNTSSYVPFTPTPTPQKPVDIQSNPIKVVEKKVVDDHPPNLYQYQQCKDNTSAHPDCALRCDPKDQHCQFIQNKFYACREHNSDCTAYLKWFETAQATDAIPQIFYNCLNACKPTDQTSNFSKYIYGCEIPCSKPLPNEQ